MYNRTSENEQKQAAAMFHAKSNLIERLVGPEERCAQRRKVKETIGSIGVKDPIETLQVNHVVQP